MQTISDVLCSFPWVWNGPTCFMALGFEFGLKPARRGGLLRSPLEPNGCLRSSVLFENRDKSGTVPQTRMKADIKKTRINSGQ